MNLPNNSPLSIGLRKHSVRDGRLGDHSSGASERPLWFPALPQGGFTLIELAGVLAIVAILVATMTVSVVKRVDQAAWTRETADLSVIANSYSQYILRKKIIPDQDTWVSAVANQLSLSVNAVTNNPRGLARAFLIDPNLSLGGASLPYVQTNNGTPKPVSARVLIVSSLARALPVASGKTNNSAQFDAIWNTAEGVKPTGAPWTSWVGTGGELRIQKVNLEPLFSKLVLIDHDDANVARFSVDNTNTVTVPTGGLGWNKYYIQGTVVGLHNASGAIQTKYLVKRDISFVYTADAWTGTLGTGDSTNPLADRFAALAAIFFGTTNSPAATAGGSVYSTLVAMHTFLFDYTLWANECPHFDTHGTSTSPEATLLYSIGGNSQYLDKFSGAGGLLK